MPRLSNILCPVDFDQGTLPAVPIAAELAQENKAALYLLHVVRLHPAAEPALSFGEAEDALRLSALGIRNSKSEPPIEVHVIAGDPRVEVLQAATRLGIDLIVMETHGRKGLRRIALGSVAERLAREAQCPVLTVKPIGLPRLWPTCSRSKS